MEDKEQQKNRTSDLSSTAKGSTGSADRHPNTNKTVDDGVSGKAEQEEIASRNSDVPGNDEEDAADLESLNGVVEREESKKEPN